jgi:hypothetical protein
MFSITFIVLVSAAMGAVIDGSDPPRGYEAAIGLFIALGVGAGLWLLSEWRDTGKKEKRHGDEEGDGYEGDDDGAPPSA